MKRTSPHTPPLSLQKRVLMTACEVAPVAGDFRIKDAGKTLAHLFGPELLTRLAARAATNHKEKLA